MSDLANKLKQLRGELSIQEENAISDWKNASIGDALSELPPETHVDKAIGKFTAKFTKKGGI